MFRRFSCVSCCVAAIVAGTMLGSVGAQPVKEAEEPGDQVVQVPPVQPVQPLPAVPLQPISTEGLSATAGLNVPAGLFTAVGASPATGGASVNPLSAIAGALSASQQAAPETSSNLIGGGDSASRATTDLGNFLGETVAAPGVEVHQRSPIISDPVIRGYRMGQYVTQSDGGFWFPARIDLDTIVSKIDSSLIENVVIIKGPYSVRYGPGFSFIDVETLATPRYQNGFEMHTASGLTYKTNGQQWQGIESVWGGNESFGFRVNYLIGTGTDYWDGDGVRQPSGYNSQTFNLDLGYTLDRYSRVEFKGTHLEQNDVKIPGAFYDINFLSSDAYTLRYIFDDREYYRFTLDTWFNYTRLYGDNLLPSKREQFIGSDVGPVHQLFLPDARLASSGYRAAFTSGARDSLQVTVGTDLRFLVAKQNQFQGEFNTATGEVFLQNGTIPPSYLSDPGLFFDASLPLLDNRLLVKSGVRFDWVHTAISRLEVDPIPFPVTIAFLPAPTDPGQYFAGIALTGQQLSNDYTLWSAFITPEWKVTDEVTLFAGFGYAQRPPTLEELYTINTTIGVIQRGGVSAIGNPLLAPETLNQLDVGLRLNYERFRGGISGFYAWIHNYITYQNIITFSDNLFENAFAFINTREATLAGGELFGEWDSTRWLTLFGTMAYVEGNDQTVDGRLFAPSGAGVTGVFFGSGVPGPNTEALPNIPPLNTRLGFRVHDSAERQTWAVEFTARIVDEQDRVANTLGERRTGGFTTYDVRGYWQYNRNLLLTAGMENIGDVKYREHFDIRTPSASGNTVFQPGFNFYCGARVTY